MSTPRWTRRLAQAARIEALETDLRRLVNACTMPGLLTGEIREYVTRKPEWGVVEAARRTLLSTTKEEDRES